MTSILFYILALLTVVTVLWQALVGPMLRVSLRYKLFSLRDEIHRAMVENPDAEDLKRLEDITNGAVFLIHRIDVVTWEVISRGGNENSEATSSVAIEQNPFSEKVISQCCRAVHAAAGVNSFLLLLFATPLILPLVFLLDTCRDWFKNKKEAVEQLVLGGESSFTPRLRKSKAFS